MENFTRFKASEAAKFAGKNLLYRSKSNEGHKLCRSIGLIAEREREGIAPVEVRRSYYYGEFC